VLMQFVVIEGVALGLMRRMLIMVGRLFWSGFEVDGPFPS
jgi:hypothetical protein